MKSLLAASAIILSTVCFGQTQHEKLNGLKLLKPDLAFQTDTTIQVIYKSKVEEQNINAAFFINGNQVSEYNFKGMNPRYVKDVSVEKGEVEVNGVKYPAKVSIETKADYRPNFISLNDFKEKHVDIKEKSILFQIDDEIVLDDYDNYMIDENYILKTIVEKVKNKRLNFTLIKLLTRSEKNLQDSKRIMIRGQEGLAVNHTL